MQSIFIFQTFLAIYCGLGLSQCLTKDNVPQLLYPSLNSPFILDVNEYQHDSNLQFTVSDLENTTLNTTYYQSAASLVQQIQLNGIIISSNQFIQYLDYSTSQTVTGTIALLVKNITGYYVYQITQSNYNYNVTFIGDGITIPIICYKIVYQTQNILFVSCLNQSQNQTIIYQYDLTAQQIQPTIYYGNTSQQNNITNNFISNNYYQEYYLTSIYTSAALNTTTLYQLYIQNHELRPISQYSGYLTDMVIYNNFQFLLFSDYLLYNGITFSSNNSLFLKFAIIGPSQIIVYIVTQNSIFQLQVGQQNQIQFVDQIEYQTEFYIDINSNVQIYADSQYIIVSNSTLFLVYEQANHKLFWKYQLQQQSLIQYDYLSKIITIITQSSIQAFQLFQPQILLYFDQSLSGKLVLSLVGSNVNCSIQLSYIVLSISDPGPYPNYLDQTYQSQNFQESQIQCVSCRFTGQNLTYNQYSTNINFQYYQYQIKDLFNSQDIYFYYIYSNQFNPQQYLIFYQLQNDQNLFVIYCGLQYCLQSDSFQTLNASAFTKLTGDILQLSIKQDYQNLEYNIEIFYCVNDGINDYYYSCQFQWFQASQKCQQYDQLDILQQIFPLSIIQGIYLIGSNVYVGFSNPQSIYYMNQVGYNQFGLVYQNFQFVPRQIYYNEILYNNLIFIDNVYQLNVYELVVNGTYLNYITSIQYPLQQGNTSVVVGLLDKAIVITQIDDQGNQYILFYDRMILRPINIIQQPQPQSVQIPSGAQIQFPIVSSYTNSKFYLVWQYNQNSEIAVFQYSSTINNMLLTSIYIDGQINSIQAISQGIQDVLLCQYNQSKILQITIQNQFFIQLSSNLLLQNETFSNVSIVYQAESQLSQAYIINQYTFTNQIFQINKINQYIEIELNNTYYFRLLATQFYYGLVNNFQSNPKNLVIGPFINSNILINNGPVPSLFFGEAFQIRYRMFYEYYPGLLLFQNNTGLYQVMNLGIIRLVTKFQSNLNCPILSGNQYGSIISICQITSTQLVIYSSNFDFATLYSSDIQNYFLLQPFNLINGQLIEGYYYEGYNNAEYLILNFGQAVQFIFQSIYIYEYNMCQYTNYDINITKVLTNACQNYLISILQIQGSNDFIILKFNYDCNILDQQRIVIDSKSFGNIVYLDLYQQYQYFLYPQEDLLLTVTTTKMILIYKLNSNINEPYIVNYSQDPVPIQAQIINDYIIAIYNTTQNGLLNYSVVLYNTTKINETQFPIIAYFNEFYGTPQQFYLTQDGTLIYTYTHQNKSGFSYIQLIPYIYIGLNNQDQITSQINQTYGINSYKPILTISNQFNSINISLNITVNQYLGEKYINLLQSSQIEKILLIISVISIIGFLVFMLFKIMAKNKME